MRSLEIICFCIGRSCWNLFRRFWLVLSVEGLGGRFLFYFGRSGGKKLCLSFCFGSKSSISIREGLDFRFFKIRKFYVGVKIVVGFFSYVFSLYVL